MRRCVFFFFILFGEITLRQRAAIIAGGHGLAISSGRTESNEVAAQGRGQEFVTAEHVAALADRSHDVVGLERSLGARSGGEVFREMVRAVHGGSDKVREACIYNDEFAAAAFFHVERTGDERAALPHDAAP